MKLIIHDLSNEQFKKLFPNELNDIKVISNDGKIKNCIGCFGCWIKTPGVCVVSDNYKNMGEIFSKCDEVTIISKCCYGGYSSFVKNVIDRALSYIHPNLVMRNGEMHHKRRYSNKFKMNIWFYGEDITEKEKETARKLINANEVNYDSYQSNIVFVKSINEMEGRIQ